MQLNVPTTVLDLEQVRIILNNMKHLQKLDIEWNREVWRLLKLTFITNLRELTVRIKMHIRGKSTFYGQDENASLFLTPTYSWIKEWMGMGFVPQIINFITLSLGHGFSVFSSK